MPVNAKPFILGQRLLARIVRAVSKEGPSVPVTDHHRAQILAARSANRDCPPISIGVLPFTDDVSTRDQGLEVRGGMVTRRPAVRAVLSSFWRVDTPEPVGDPVQLQRVAIGDGLRKRSTRHEQEAKKCLRHDAGPETHLLSPLQPVVGWHPNSTK